MAARSHGNSQLFLFRWVIANTLGLPVLIIPYKVGFFLMAGFAIMSDGAADEYLAYVAMGFGIVVLAVVGAILGAWLGLLQWLVLRKRILHAGKWIALTALGMAAGAPLGALLYAILFAVFVMRPDGAYFSFAYEYLAFGPALGLAIGATQASLLKRWINDAKWWIIALPMFFTLGMLFANINRVSNTFIMPIHGLTQRLTTLFPEVKSIQVFFVFELLTAVIALISVSLVTGILLNWLLQDHKRQ